MEIIDYIEGGIIMLFLLYIAFNTYYGIKNDRDNGSSWFVVVYFIATVAFLVEGASFTGFAIATAIIIFGLILLEEKS